MLYLLTMPVNFCVRFTIFPSNKINIQNRQYHILLFCLLFKNCIKKTATTKKKNPKSESVCINKNVGQNDQSCTFCDCSRNMIVITAGIYLRSGCTSFLPEVSWSANRRDSTHAIRRNTCLSLLVSQLWLDRIAGVKTQNSR